MTEPNDAAHLGLERLADLDEGLLSPDQATAARAHLTTCTQCQDDLSTLASVRAALLADAEVPTPPEVADRWYAALAAEPPLTSPATAAGDGPATGEPATAPPSELAVSASVTTLPVQRDRSAWQRRRPAAALLAAVAGVALIAVGIVQLGNRNSDTAEKSGAATTTAPASAPTLHTGQDYTDADLSAGALALLPGSAGASSAAAAATAAAGTTAAAATSAAATSAATPGAVSGAGAGVTGGAAATTGAPAAAATPAAASAAGTAAAGTGAAGFAAATSAAASITHASPVASAAAPTTDVLAPLRAPGAAQACLSSLLPDAGAPLVIDFAAYNGRPAIIGVFHDPSRSGLLQVIAAGPPGCVLYTIKFPAAP